MAEESSTAAPGAGAKDERAHGLCAAVASAPDWERRGLSARGRRVAFAVAEALLCNDAGGGVLAAPAAMCARSVDGFDRAVGTCSGTLRAAMRLFLWLVEWLPVIVAKRARRASAMTLVERVRYLEALEASPSPLLATLFVAVKVPLTLSAYEEGEALAVTGFDRETTASRRRTSPGVIGAPPCSAAAPREGRAP